MSVKIRGLATLGVAMTIAASSQAIFFFEDFEQLVVGGSYTGNWGANNYFAINEPGNFFTFGGARQWNVGFTMPGNNGIDIVRAPYLRMGTYGIDLAGTPGPGSISTTLNFSAGQQYKLTFLAAASSATYNDIEVRVGANVHTLNNFITQSTSALNLHSFVFTSDGGSLFELRSLAGGNGNLFLDNIMIEAVPEPFTMALGAAGIGLAVRRRMKKTA